jgi:chemotaxis protein methyltransferase CheR
MNLTKETVKPAITTSRNTAVQEENFQIPPLTRAWDRAPMIKFLREEKFKEAIEFLRGLPEESKADADTQLLLAVLLTNIGDLSQAEKVCEHLLKLDELNTGAHYLLALCRERAGDRKAAIEHDHAAVRLDAAFAMPHLHIGLLAKHFADVQTAKREFGQALTLLAREHASRILLFGGGFTREALTQFCCAELRTCGANS